MACRLPNIYAHCARGGNYLRAMRMAHKLFTRNMCMRTARKSFILRRTRTARRGGDREEASRETAWNEAIASYVAARK